MKIFLLILKIFAVTLLFATILFLNTILFNWINDLFEQKLILLHHKLEAQTIIGITTFTVFLLIIILIIIYTRLEKNRKFAQCQQEFIDTVTHELKTSISTISILSQNTLRGTAKTPEKYADYGTRIHTESVRLKKTLDYFMLYSKLHHNTPHQKELCNLNDILFDVYTQNAPQAEHENFVTEIAIPEQNLYIMANHYAIELIIRNLLENVLKYAKNGGYMSLKLYTDEDKKRAIIEIADKGTGITENEQKKVFECFTRGKEALQKQIPGSGIGLYLVKKIVESYDGTVSLKSSSGIGSVFILKFPIIQ